MKSRYGKGDTFTHGPIEILQEKMNAFSGPPPNGPRRDVHTDEDTAQKSGLPGTVAPGVMLMSFVSEMLTKAFGQGWVKGGKISVVFFKIVQTGDTILARAMIKDTVKVNSETEAHLEVWCENQEAEKVLVGTATAKVS